MTRRDDRASARDELVRARERAGTALRLAHSEVALTGGVTDGGQRTAAIADDLRTAAAGLRRAADAVGEWADAADHLADTLEA